MKTNIITLFLTLSIASGMAVSANAADYTFKTDPNPEYYKSTNYEELYDAGYNYGAQNQIEFDIPELKYGLSQEFLKTTLNNPYISSGIQNGIGGSSGFAPDSLLLCPERTGQTVVRIFDWQGHCSTFDLVRQALTAFSRVCIMKVSSPRKMEVPG